jgi:hypothetical protein
METDWREWLRFNHRFNSINMKQEKKQHKDLKYPFRGFKISDEVYQEMKDNKEDGETWNQFFKRIIKVNKGKNV